MVINGLLKSAVRECQFFFSSYIIFKNYWAINQDWGFPGGSVVKNLPAGQEMWVQSLGGKDPWRRKWQPIPVFLPGASHRQRRLMGCGPWGCKSWTQVSDWITTTNQDGNVVCISQMKKLRHEKTKELAKEHRTSTWQSRMQTHGSQSHLTPTLSVHTTLSYRWRTESWSWRDYLNLIYQAKRARITRFLDYIWNQGCAQFQVNQSEW